MPLDPRTPVIVGVGQRNQRVDDPLESLTPADFIAEAVRDAAADAGLSSLAAVDSVRVVSERLSSLFLPISGCSKISRWATAPSSPLG